jgi:aldose 1-epimerase
MSETLVESSAWGHTLAGEPVELFTLTSASAAVKIATYGARLISIRTPDRAGAMAEVILGADALEPYLTEKKYLGAAIGRFGNRIAHGRFVLDGETYQLPLNNGPNSLHGGTIGFDKKVWTAAPVPGGVRMEYVSPAGEMGYPGTLHAAVTYTLAGSALMLTYEATTDAPTVVNMTNHAYFNLAGAGGDLDRKTGADALGAHTIRLNAERFTPVDAGLIPTGELRPVAGTPMDLREAKVIGLDWDSDDEQMVRAGGYDHNWVLQPASGPDALRWAAELTDPASGRTLTVSTTEPGIQFYSGNFLDGLFVGRGGLPVARRSGCCLETQHFPDSPNHPEFPTTTLRPGETLRSVTVFAFGIV